MQKNVMNYSLGETSKSLSRDSSRLLLLMTLQLQQKRRDFALRCRQFALAEVRPRRGPRRFTTTTNFSTLCHLPFANETSHEHLALSLECSPRQTLDKLERSRQVEKKKKTRKYKLDARRKVSRAPEESDANQDGI